MGFSYLESQTSSGEKMSLPVPQIQKILFTTDLSQQARHAFTYAAGVAHQYRATLTILYVMEDLPMSQSANLRAFIGSDRWDELQKSYAQQTQQILIGKKREGALIREALGGMAAATQKDFPERKLEPEEVVVTQGDTVECICQEAEARQMDLIIMGYHPRGRIEEAIFGSVSRSVLRRSRVPVLLVPLPELEI
jgi:nucleotide-binding universal stress UspA family protein